MASPTLFFSTAVSPRLLFRFLPRRPKPKPPLLHLPVPRRGTLTFASPAMSSALRFSMLDDADDPLDFGAVAGTSFLPLRRCARKKNRSASPEVVEVRPDGGGGAEEEAGPARKINRSASPEVVEVRAALPEVVEVRPDGGGGAEEEAGVKAGPAKKGNYNTLLDKKGVKILGNSDTHLDEKVAKVIGNSNTYLDKKSVKIMTYNVWFVGDLELKRRMNALGNLIRHHSPDLICFQEVTPDIYLLFEKSDWWEGYKCSLPHEKAMVGAYYCMQMSKLPVKSFDRFPFSNSVMGRDLCIADVNIGDGIELMLATSHLESPCPSPPTWDQMYSKERVAQANESFSLLETFRNVIFCGDMNWDDKNDGPFPLPDGWIDAWTELKPDENCWTYDTKANGMLSANRKLQKRLDRFVCKLSDFKVDSIEMIGKEAIQGITYIKKKKVRNEIRQLQLPVFPSDHFGLLLTITYKPEDF